MITTREPRSILRRRWKLGWVPRKRDKGRILLKDDFTSLALARGIEAGWTGYSLGHHDDAESAWTPETGDNFAVADAPGRAGETCLQVTIRDNDYTTAADRDASSGPPANLIGKERAELLFTPSPALSAAPILWYGYSLYIPEDYDYTLNDTNGLFQIMGQWHDNGVGGGLEPPCSIAFRQTAPGGTATLRLRYGLEGGTQLTANTTISRATWYNLKFKFFWSKTASGYVSIYINGVLATTLTAANIYAAQADVHNTFRLGIYRGFDQAQTNTFYIGRARCALNEADLDFPNT